VIGTVNLAVAIHTTSVESEDVETGDGRMAWQQIDVALLAQLMTARGQQADVIGTVRVMANQAVLLHWGMLPEQGTPLVGVALITRIID